MSVTTTRDSVCIRWTVYQYIRILFLLFNIRHCSFCPRVNNGRRPLTNQRMPILIHACKLWTSTSWARDLYTGCCKSFATFWESPPRHCLVAISSLSYSTLIASSVLYNSWYQTYFRFVSLDFNMLKGNNIPNLIISHFESGKKAPEIVKLLTSKVHRAPVNR